MGAARIIKFQLYIFYYKQILKNLFLLKNKNAGLNII